MNGPLCVVEHLMVQDATLVRNPDATDLKKKQPTIHPNLDGFLSFQD